MFFFTSGGRTLSKHPSRLSSAIMVIDSRPYLCANGRKSPMTLSDGFLSLLDSNSMTILEMMDEKKLACFVIAEKGFGIVKQPSFLNHKRWSLKLIPDVVDHLLSNAMKFVKVEKCGFWTHHVLLHFRPELLPPFTFLNQDSGCLPKQIRSA
jgi:hypothetical protein